MTPAHTTNSLACSCEIPPVSICWRQRKRRRINLCRVASAMALSVAMVAAFQVDTLQTRLSPYTTTLSTKSQTTCHRNNVWQLAVATDPDLLLRSSLETLYSRSPSEYSNENSFEDIPFFRNSNPEAALRKKTTAAALSKNIRKAATKAIVTDDVSLSAKGKKMKTVSRSSTMPGFSGRALTGRQKSFRDSVRMVEERTGKKYVDTPAAKRKRRKENGEHMYKNSASVPDSLIKFASEIHNVDRIGPKEEILLGEKTQEAIRLQNLHSALQTKLAREPTDEEWCAAAGKINTEMLRDALEEGLEAKNKLVTSNLRMVQSVVNLYIRNGLGPEYNAGDLMQEGIVALIRAAEKYDPGRGFRFSTYAMYWIRSAVKRSQIVQSHIITVPQRLYENHKRILRVSSELQETLGRKPTKKEIGEVVGMSEVQVERCMKSMSMRCYSLDQGLTNMKKPMSGEEKKETMIEVVESKTEDGEYQKQNRIFFKEDLIKTLYRHLQPNEVQILLLRYGLMDDFLPDRGFGPLTIAEVSRLVGLKPDKVRRIINKSLKQLKAIIGDEWLDYAREMQH